MSARTSLRDSLDSADTVENRLFYYVLRGGTYDNNIIKIFIMYVNQKLIIIKILHYLHLRVRNSTSLKFVNRNIVKPNGFG